MPWTEKQMRLFRAAAHDKGIAAKTGVKQSDARRMMKEGVKKKFAAGGKVAPKPVAPVEEPTGKALEDLRRQRDQQRMEDAENKAPTTKKEMDRFAKGGYLKQGVGIRDTKHGLLDLPVHEGKKMRKPKIRYEHGGGVSSGVRRLKQAKKAPMGFSAGGAVRCNDGCAVRGLTRAKGYRKG